MESIADNSLGLEGWFTKKLVLAVPIFLVAAIAVVITPTLAFAHTSAYWTGYNQGKLDRQNGTNEPPHGYVQYR
jgi:hypothetical protein